MRRIAPILLAALLGLAGAVVLFGGSSDEDLAPDGAPGAAAPPRTRPTPRSGPGGPTDVVDGRPTVPARPPGGASGPGAETLPGEAPRRGTTPQPESEAAADAPGGVPDPDAADRAREFDTPDAADRATWMEERVVTFLDRVDPGERPLARSCTPDGTSCTFEGPVSDDFARRLLTQASGVKQDDLLEGITFSELRFEDREGTKHVVLTSRHPDAPAAPR